MTSIQRRFIKPKLRFSQFESEWDQAKMHTLTSVLRCGIAATPTYVEDGVPFLSAQNVSRTGNITLNKYSFISEDYYKKLSKNHSLKKGDILYSRVGATYGNAAIFPYEGDFGVYVSLTHMRTRKGISNSYMKYFLNSPYGKRQAFRGVFQGGGVPNLNVKVVEKFDVTYPSLPEQQKIATFLSAVDKKIQLLQRKKELLEQYKKGVMQKIFSQEIRFKDDDGNDYPDWEEKRLGDLADFNPKSNELPERFVYIDLESVKKGRLLKETEIELSTAPSRAQRLLAKDDILFQTVRPYQRNNYHFMLDGFYVASTGYAQIRAKYDARFLFHLLQHQPLVNLVIRWSTGSNYPAVNSSDLKRILHRVPTKTEQKKIGAFLSNIEKKMESLLMQMQQIHQFKKGLLQQMFV